MNPFIVVVVVFAELGEKLCCQFDDGILSLSALVLDTNWGDFLT